MRHYGGLWFVCWLLQLAGVVWVLLTILVFILFYQLAETPSGFSGLSSTFTGSGADTARNIEIITAIAVLSVFGFNIVFGLLLIAAGKYMTMMRHVAQNSRWTVEALRSRPDFQPDSTLKADLNAFQKRATRRAIDDDEFAPPR